MRIFLSIIILLVSGVSLDLKAQIAEEEENTFYQTFPDHIMGRLYLSRKYTSLWLRDNVEGQSYLFAPNSTLNHGIGATYKWATLNLAYGFEALNPDRGRGDTQYLDLQAHAYWI